MSKFVIVPKSFTYRVENRQAFSLNPVASQKSSFGIWDILFYSKKNTDVIQYKQFDGGFIGCIGTPVFFKEDVLDQVYHHFHEGSIGEYCDIIGGHYVLLVFKSNQLFVISDGIGSIDIFYGNGVHPIISNDFSCSSLNMTLSPDLEMCELDSVYLNSGPRTPFPEVSKLIGGIEYIKICSDGKVDVCRHHNTIANRLRKFSDWNQMDYFHQVKKVYLSIKNTNAVFGLNFTGGLDGRTILASLLDLKANVEFYYGIGNSQITNTQNKDFEISSEIARELKIRQETMNWETDEKDLSDKSVFDNYEKMGLFARIHGGSNAFVQSLIDRNREKRDIVFMGGFSPGFSNKDFHERTYPNFLSIVKDCLKGPLESVAFKHYKKAFKKFYDDCRTYCIAHDLIDESDALLVEGHIVRALLYIRPESEHLQLFNQFDKYLAPYNTNELLIPMLAIDTSFRSGRKLQLNLIQQLRPDLLKYHLFSGIADRTITEKLEIETKRDEKKSFRIPMKYLAYRYYMYKRPVPKTHKGQDAELYKKVIELLESEYKNRWFGFAIFNLRYCLRLRYSYRLGENQKSLNYRAERS